MSEQEKNMDQELASFKGHLERILKQASADGIQDARNVQSLDAVTPDVMNTYNRCLNFTRHVSTSTEEELPHLLQEFSSIIAEIKSQRRAASDPNVLSIYGYIANKLTPFSFLDALTLEERHEFAKKALKGLE